MMTMASDKWKPSDGICLERTADAAVKSNENTLVIAGPGAGKTELLAQKANYLFQTNICSYPSKILAISFKKDAAYNLKQRVIKRCGEEIESRFISMTYDAFSKSILDHFRFALPENIRPNFPYLINDSKIIEEAFKKSGYINHGYSDYSKKIYFDNALSSIDLSLSYHNDDLTENVWKMLLKGFDDNKPNLTFKMICMLAEYIIRTNPKIRKCLQLTYKYVFLDEFQDTTSLQYNLIKQCFLNSGSVITAVGDNKQRIMLWAGAKKTVFEDFQRDFSAKAERLVMNHRSAPRLVQLQKNMYDSLNEKGEAVFASNKWRDEDGTIILLVTNNENLEATDIAEHISSKILSGMSPENICILCKQKPEKYTSKIIQELNKRNIIARIENEYQDLIKEPIVELLVSFLSLSDNRTQPQKWEFITSLMSNINGINSSHSNEDFYKIQEKIDIKLCAINYKISTICNESEFRILIEEILQFFGESQLKALFPQYTSEEYFQKTVNEFVKLLWKEFEKSNMNCKLALENFNGSHSIPIMTIHKSKGLEYDVVFFVGLEDSAFWNFKNQPEEDRCAFFVALSRAKKEVYFTFSNFRNNRIQQHYEINEFYNLLNLPGMATVINR